MNEYLRANHDLGQGSRVKYSVSHVTTDNSVVAVFIDAIDR